MCIGGRLRITTVVIPILSASAGLTTAQSVKFNLHDQQLKLNKTIDILNKIKCKMDYVVSCNGNFRG